MKKKLKELSRENLQNIILDMAQLLSREQRQKLETLIDDCAAEKLLPEKKQLTARMPQELVDEKMEQLKGWMKQIDEGRLYLRVEQYEDYSSGYWNSDWIVEYYDNQGIGDKITYAIRFAKDCVDDRRYQEANFIYKWLWEMSVSTEYEYDCDPADLKALAEHEIISTDMERLALLTLYADYQAQDAAKRAENLYLYFSYRAFRELHIEDMLYVGRENLPETDRFWKDWIRLLKSKSGQVEARLLQEAVLYNDGIEELVKTADEICNVHPSLYLTAMKEYDKNHDYEQIEKIGERAIAKLDIHLKIRSEIALKAAYASSCLMHAENVMLFCWECFRSDSTVKNLLRLFGTKEMAAQYGMRGKEVLFSRIKGNSAGFGRNTELRQNIIGDFGYYELAFYTGDFEIAKRASKNPQGSLGWGSRFIRRGIRLFLLYLYEKPLPSKAAAVISDSVGFGEDMDDDTDLRYALSFEGEIIEESRKHKTSVFWNYFKRWKQHFEMESGERKKYLAWAEKIVYGRADAIVSGQHRGHYGDVAALLAMAAEIKEDMGTQGAKSEVFSEYKRKFPRHSSFQAEMKKYFNYF